MSHPYDDENLNRPEEINPSTDYLIECPECGQYRHKSWFSVERRGCAACSFFGREYLNGLGSDVTNAGALRLAPPSPIILPPSYGRKN